MESALEDFAHNTRLPLDDPLLLHKYLAVHVAQDAHVTYAHLGATDYARVRLNAHNPPLETYSQSKEIDAGVFLEAMKGIGNSSSSPSPLLEDFESTFFPRPKDEEVWVKHVVANQDHWKPAALLLCLAMGRDKPNFPKLARAIDPNINLIQLASYEVSPKELAREAAKQIAQIKTDNDMVLCEKVVEEEEKKMEQQQQVEVDVDAIPLATQAPWDDSMYQVHPLIRDWKTKCGLSQLFPNDKTIRQLVARYIGVENVPGSLLASRQRNPLPQVEPISSQDWAMLMSPFPVSMQEEFTFRTKDQEGFEERWKTITNQEWNPKKWRPVHHDILNTLIRG